MHILTPRSSPSKAKNSRPPGPRQSGVHNNSSRSAADGTLPRRTSRPAPRTSQGSTGEPPILAFEPLPCVPSPQPPQPVVLPEPRRARGLFRPLNGRYPPSTARSARHAAAIAGAPVQGTGRSCRRARRPAPSSWTIWPHPGPGIRLKTKRGPGQPLKGGDPPIQAVARPNDPFKAQHEAPDQKNYPLPNRPKSHFGQFFSKCQKIRLKALKRPLDLWTLGPGQIGGLGGLDPPTVKGGHPHAQL